MGFVCYRCRDINEVTKCVTECWNHGVYVIRGAKLNARECEVGKNGGHGVWVDGSTTTALLTDCTSHHNRGAGVFANSGGAVDLMGEDVRVRQRRRRSARVL